MKTKRVTLFAGHYGSGKTNVAVNYAMYLRSLFDKVLIADLDVVNPYFRTKDSAEELAAAGIHLISPEFANTNVDLPALPTEMYAIVDRTDYHAVETTAARSRSEDTSRGYLKRTTTKCCSCATDSAPSRKPPPMRSA